MGAKLDYRLSDDAIWSYRTLETGQQVAFTATDVRRERTGVHARVEISLNDVSLAHDTFNVGRHRERDSLAKAAHKLLGNVTSELYSLESLQHEFDLFCRDLWAAWSERYMPQETAGDPNSPPASFIIPGLVIVGGGTILFAPPGTGKSYTAKIIAVSAQHGCCTLWRIVRPFPTLLVNLERSEASIRSRLGRVNLALGLEAYAKLHQITARGRRLADVLPMIRRYVREQNMELVIVDSLSRAGYGSLIEDEAANSAMDALNSLGCAWLIIAHTGWREEHEFGSVMFRAAADVSARLTSQRSDSTLGVKIEVAKANDFDPGPSKLFALEFDAAGLAAIRAPRLGEFPDLMLAAPSTRELIRSYVHGVGRCTVGEIAAEVGLDRTTVQRIVHDAQLYRRERDGKRFLYSVLERERS